MDWTLKEAEISEIASQLRKGRELPEILSRLAKAISMTQEERRRETKRLSSQMEEERSRIEEHYQAAIRQTEERFTRELARISEKSNWEEPSFSIEDGCLCVRQGEDSRALFSLEELAGQEGKPGPAGARGRNAAINGVNTLTLEADRGILLEQQGEMMRLSSEDHIETRVDTEGTATEAQLLNNVYYNLRRQAQITLTMPEHTPKEGFHCMLDFTGAQDTDPVFNCPDAFTMRGRDCTDGVFIPKKGEAYCIVFYVDDGCRGVVG